MRISPLVLIASICYFVTREKVFWFLLWIIFEAAKWAIIFGEGKLFHKFLTRYLLGNIGPNQPRTVREISGRQVARPTEEGEMEHQNSGRNMHFDIKTMRMRELLNELWIGIKTTVRSCRKIIKGLYLTITILNQCRFVIFPIIK